MKLGGALILYGSLVAAWALLRGTMTPLPPAWELWLAAAVLGIGLWAGALVWRSRQPVAESDGAGAGRGRPLLVWAAWLALLLGLFAGPLRQVAQRVAAPVAQTEGREAGEAAGEDPGERAGGPLAAAPQAEPAPSAPTEQATEASASAPAAADEEGSRLWLILLMLGAALVCGCLVALLWRALRRRRRALQERDGPAARNELPSYPVPEYVRELRRLCAVGGGAAEHGRTVRDLVRQLRQAGLPGDELQPVEAYHYSVSYEGAPADRALERRLRRRLRALKAPQLPPGAKA